MKKIFIFLILLLVGCSSSYSVPDTIQLQQLPGQSERQSMAYIITNQDNQIFIVDGGTIDDLDYLIEKVLEINPKGEVTGWFLTHYHNDHTGALAEYINTSRSELDIKQIYMDFPNEAWVAENEPNRLSDFQSINNALKSVKNAKHVKAGDILNYSGVSIDVVRSSDLEIKNNAGNNSSVVYKFYTKSNTILFLGDLGVEGGQSLLADHANEIKDIDYVQMAHHGQAGVEENVYQWINPTYCLWPTPDWLWYNSDKIYKTDETKQWMKSLHVKKNYIAKDGFVKIDIH